jgi:hypothetical protein
VLLIVLNSEKLDADQQAMLEDFIAGGGELAAFNGRARVILCAEASLSALADAGEFNEMLLMRAGAMKLNIPRLAQRREDLVQIARAVLRSTQGRAVLVLLAAWLIYQGWLSAAAPDKIVGEFPADREKLAVLVTLPFPPERFHVLVFQRFGRVSGTDGTTVEVRGVPRTELVRLARPYWVSRVEPLKQP